jgi:tricorn protease-like protein
MSPSRIVVMSSDGGILRDVTDAAAQNQSPIWAPDNRHLYFVSNRQGPYDVYALELSPDGRATGMPTRVTTGLGVYSMTFAANGERLAYAAYSARANLFSLPIPKKGTVDVAQARAVTSGNQQIQEINASPDGKWILYDSTLYGAEEIFRIPTAGGAAERLTNGGGDHFAPDLSPDGRFLAYHSWRTKSRDVFVQPLDGGPVEQVTNTPGQEAMPRWFADGRSILFWDFGGPSRYNWVQRDASGHWSTTPIPLPFLSEAQGLTWLRDGRTLVCARDNVIWTVDFYSHVRHEVYRPRDTSDPAVTSMRQDFSGNPLYFKSHDAQGISSFWSVPITGGRPTRLVTFSDSARQSGRYDFAVDATRFYFTIDERQSNIWIADVTGH